MRTWVGTPRNFASVGDFLPRSQPAESFSGGLNAHLQRVYPVPRIIESVHQMHGFPCGSAVRGDASGVRRWWQSKKTWHGQALDVGAPFADAFPDVGPMPRSAGWSDLSVRLTTMHDAFGDYMGRFRDRTRSIPLALDAIPRSWRPQIGWQKRRSCLPSRPRAPKLGPSGSTQKTSSRK